MLTLFSVGLKWKFSFLKFNPKDITFSCQDLLCIYTRILWCYDAIAK